MEKTQIAALFGLLAALAASPGEGNGRFVGDRCKVNNESLGICRNIKNCAEAQEKLKEGRTPTTCGYNGDMPIVCCPQNNIAEKMCSKYSEAVFENVLMPVPLQKREISAKIDRCAKSSVPLIVGVGGEDVDPNEYPHMALIGYGSDPKTREWGCGGSLISNWYVMTAAHCLNSHNGPARWVRLGELDISNDNEPINKHVDYMVTETIPHPNWKDSIYYDDIALLKLDREVQFTASIRPACLHPIKEIAEMEVIAPGWGYTDWAIPILSNKLMKMKLLIQKTEDCQRAHKTLTTTSYRLVDGIRGESMVCAGNRTGGVDTCKGDSGGPLQIKLSNPYCMYSIVGITSFGKNVCGSPNSPAVYTRVSHFVPWIESIVWPDVN